MNRKQKANFLDYVPKHNSLFPYQKNENRNIEIMKNNRGIFNRIAQSFWGRPKVSRIELDTLGSFIWQQIDGEKDVYRIGLLVKEKFGQEAEPLYERLTEFLYVLRRNKFILYENLKRG